MRIPHLALLEAHLFAQRGTDPHYNRAMDLRHQVAGVENRAALENLADVPDDKPFLFAVDSHLDASGHIRAFLSSTGEAHAQVTIFFLYALAPVESPDGFFQ